MHSSWSDSNAAFTNTFIDAILCPFVVVLFCYFVKADELRKITLLYFPICTQLTFMGNKLQQQLICVTMEMENKCDTR